MIEDIANAIGPLTQPTPPYLAVIFTSLRTRDGQESYDAMADRMLELAWTMPGFLGIESVRNSDGLGITVSYWTDEKAIENWRQNAEHVEAQKLGHQRWYERYQVRICSVQRAYSFPKS